MTEQRNLSHGKENNAGEQVTAVFLLGKLSATLVIPVEIARECGLDGKVVVERRNEGIFIYKSYSVGQSN